MVKPCLFLVLTLFAMTAYAEIYSCKKPNGETEFSDTPCKAGVNSEVVPDRDPLTLQQQEDAQKKLEQQKSELGEQAAQRAKTESLSEAQTLSQTVPAEDVYVGGTCNDARGPRSNCANDLYKKQLPVVQPKPRLIARPVSR